jgi:hypothetical protein
MPVGPVGSGSVRGTAARLPTDPKLLASLRNDTKTLAARLAQKDAKLLGPSGEKAFGMIYKDQSKTVRPNDLSQEGADGSALRMQDIDYDVETHDQSNVANQAVVSYSVRDALARGAITGDEAWSLRLKHKFPENETTPGAKGKRPGGLAAAGGGGSVGTGGGGSVGSGGGGSH